MRDPSWPRTSALGLGQSAPDSKGSSPSAILESRRGVPARVRQPERTTDTASLEPCRLEQLPLLKRSDRGAGLILSEANPLVLHVEGRPEQAIRHDDHQSLLTGSKAFRLVAWWCGHRSPKFEGVTSRSAREAANSAAGGCQPHRH